MDEIIGFLFSDSFFAILVISFLVVLAAMIPQFRKLLILGILTLYPALTLAQSLDLGRGEIPITVPANYEVNIPTPLIVLLHGYGGSGSGQDAYMGFSAIANEYGFIFIAPDGSRELGGRRFWNATSACCDFFNSNIDDSSYIASLIGEIKSRYNIDARRVYLVGHSNGGFMSYQIAYEHSAIVAGIASLAGASHFETRPPPANSVHILQIHGTSDSTIFYNGASILGMQYPGAMASVSTWAAYNSCQNTADAGGRRDLVSNLTGNETTTISFQSGCKTGGSAQLWTLNSAPHIPSLAPTFAAQVVEWFYAHPKSEWPAVYSGVTPAPELGLEHNNIGIFHEADVMIYSCVAVFTDGLAGSLDGVARFDLGFEVVSVADGVIRVAKSRPFNITNALDHNDAVPDCSGRFETNSGLYTDTIQVGSQTLHASFILSDAVNLELRLASVEEYLQQ